MQPKTRDILLVMFSVFLWGFAYPITKHLVNQGMHPYLVAYLRVVITLGAAGVILLAQGQRPHWQQLRGNFWPLWAMALAGAVFFYGFMSIGMQYTQAGKSTLINAINPAIIVILAHFILKEPLNWRHAVGIPLTLCGVVLSVIGDPAFALRNMSFMAGDLMFVGTAVSWASYTILSRIYGGRLPYACTFFWVFLLAAITGLPLVVPQLPQLAQITLSQWLWLLFLGALPGGLGFYLWNRGLVTVGASTCGMVNSLLPVVSIIISAFWLGEVLSPLQLTGGGLVLCGVWLGIQRGKVPAKVEA